MCKYCQGEKDIQDIHKDGILQIHKNKIALIDTEYTMDSEYIWFIRYCPMCGIKL